MFSLNLKVFRYWSIGEADVEPLDILSLPHICPRVVCDRWKEFRDVRVRGKSHLLDGIKAQIFLLYTRKRITRKL